MHRRWSPASFRFRHRSHLTGDGRVRAAHLLGLDEVPCIVLAHLTPAQRRAYVLADNKLGA